MTTVILHLELPEGTRMSALEGSLSDLAAKHGLELKRDPAPSPITYYSARPKNLPSKVVHLNFADYDTRNSPPSAA